MIDVISNVLSSFQGAFTDLQKQADNLPPEIRGRLNIIFENMQESIRKKDLNLLHSQQEELQKIIKEYGSQEIRK